MKQCDLTKGLVFFLTIIITLCCGLIPISWALDDAIGDCTNKNLRGCYGFSHSGAMIVRETVSGTVSVPVPVPMASIGFFNADGKGNITGYETLRLGNVNINAKFEGTYEINENCMGTANITCYPELDDSIEMTISLVISGRGEEEVHLLITDVYGMVPLGIVGTATRRTND